MNILKPVIIAASIFCGSTFTYAGNETQKSTHQRIYLTNDFFIQTVPSQALLRLLPHFKTMAQPTDCKSNIRQIMCLVDPAEKGQDPTMRACLPGGDKYAHYFETLHDHYPPALQRMFCSLNVIFIEKNFLGTAYAGLLKNETGQAIGAQMGIRQSVLDDNIDLTTWATWKEQLSFGGETDSYARTPHLPAVETVTQAEGLNDFLYFVVAHEFGHIFDFSNKINRTKNCPEVPENQRQPECDMDETSWGGISWLTTLKPKPENDFLYHDLLCFYTCNGNPIASENVSPLYAGHFATDFISLYATKQPWDDFADSLAYFLMNRHLQTTYVIHTNQGASYDIMAKLKSPVWKMKYDFLEKFIQNKNIIYP